MDKREKEKLNKSLTTATEASLKGENDEKIADSATAQADAKINKKGDLNAYSGTFQTDGLVKRRPEEMKTYIAIDLKSFYASVECVSRSLNTLDAFLVVADETRTDKTICLAVSPALKTFGIPGRARLFEVKQKIAEINATRKKALGNRDFSGSTIFLSEFNKDETLMLDLVVAPPRMAEYMSVSTRVYEIYKKFVAAEDIVVYSVDEVFMDVTNYFSLYKTSAHELAMRMIKAVLSETGITATAGIGTNLYLAKIALDIGAKHIEADENGVRIAELNETSYREKLWDHRPITDFWRVGKGTAEKLAVKAMYTMGDIALKSTYAEDALYDLFGVNAELLIDHAWGWEPTEIKDIRAYKPENNSISSGQVLSAPYPYEKAKLIVKEMTELLTLDLVRKGLVTKQLVLTLVYDVENMFGDRYAGAVVTDKYGRVTPKPAHGTENLPFYTSAGTLILEGITRLFERICNKKLTVRKIYVVAEKVLKETDVPKTEQSAIEQLDMFTDVTKEEKSRLELEKKLEKERARQETVLAIQKKYGKNAVVKGMNLEEGATSISRNGQIGGHKA